MSIFNQSKKIIMATTVIGLFGIAVVWEMTPTPLQIESKAADAIDPKFHDNIAWNDVGIELWNNGLKKCIEDEYGDAVKIKGKYPLHFANDEMIALCANHAFNRDWPAVLESEANKNMYLRVAGLKEKCLESTPIYNEVMADGKLTVAEYQEFLGKQDLYVKANILVGGNGKDCEVYRETTSDRPGI